MPFEKNKSGNPSGRPKGIANKSTSSLRDWITGFIDDNRQQMKEDWVALEPKDRIVLFEKLLRFALPTLQATTMDFGFDKLNEDQLDEIINRLTEANDA